MNDLCLHFANTVGWRATDDPRDQIRAYPDLLAWAEEQGVLSAQAAGELRHLAQVAPQRARASFERAIALRESIYRIFSASAAGRHPHPDDLSFLNHAVAEAYSHLRIEFGDDGFCWSWHTDENPLEQITWLVVRSAADTLTAGPLDRVKECAAHGCGWLFVDRSRNRSRRWCDMRDCGNRAKARSYLERKRQKVAER